MGSGWCVLTGGMVFTTDLVRYLDFPVVLEFMRVSRYHDKTEGQDLQWFAKPRSSLAGKNILLVDDIFDEGKTLAALRDFCYAEGAAKVVTVVLLDKEHDRRQVTYLPDLVGRVCPDRFVFGYGMDYEGLYRNWPAIHALPIE